jgi:hypothetical protein
MAVVTEAAKDAAAARAAQHPERLERAARITRAAMDRGLLNDDLTPKTGQS